MKSRLILTITLVALVALAITALSQGRGAPAALAAAQAPATTPAAAPAQQTGPGIQALNDSKYRDFVNSKCKNPPAPAPPRGGGGAGGRAPATAPPAHREYKVSEIPGVIAAGAMWKSVWTGTGNNADGPVATSDGGMMFAQNSNSKVLKLDKDGKESFPYSDTKTGGALAQNKKGALFVLERGLPQEIWQLAPKRKVMANMFNGEPLDCATGLINDGTADAKGGIYFTMGSLTAGGIYYADAKGKVTKYSTLAGNGIILSADEKTLYVTGRIAAAGAAPAAPAAPAAAPAAGGGGGARPGGLVAFDVQPDGSLKNERQFSTCTCGDGSTIDSLGRIYSTATMAGNGVEVIDKDGKVLGEIPSPLPLISVAFSGPDKKTLYGVANTQQFDEIFTIPMIAQGYKGRAK
jgi:sugar lactone lactonase YvrE